ncbi:hypothetical protein CEUSTIGMA_g13782.t1, partial [Chlamydomonas eustigma]
MLSLATLAGVGGMMESGYSMNGPGSMVGTIAIMMAIVTVHECGHFIAARSQGIRVSKFAIGFGPSLITTKRDDVEYSLRLIPLGGYVAFPEDMPTEDDQAPVFDPEDPDLLKNRSVPERALVISAGVLANIIFAYTVLLLQVGTVGKAIIDYEPGVRLPDIVRGTAAERCGLQDNDVLMQIDEWNVPASSRQVSDVVHRIKMSGGREMEFIVQRGGERIMVELYSIEGRRRH